MKVAVILPAAGLGTRMGLASPEKSGTSRKQFMLLDGLPILSHTIRKFLSSSLVTEIVVALRAEDIPWFGEMLTRETLNKPVRLVEGGDSRHQSVENALASLGADTDLVAVHDAVRPFIDPATIESVIREAAQCGAAIVGIGAQAEGIVEAVEVGAASNVDANLINEIEGVAALAARVSNPEGLGGGGDKEVRAVDPADREKAKEDIRPQLRDLALKQLQEKLESGEFIIPESLSGNILELTFDHEVTEQADDLTLVMRVAYSAEKVQSEDANSLVFGALHAQTPPGYELLPEGMTFQRGEAFVISDTQNISQTLYQFPMQGTGFAAANLDVGTAVGKIAGKSVEEATALLQDSLPLKKEPQITIFPKWFPVLPWLSFRIQTEVNPQG